MLLGLTLFPLSTGATASNSLERGRVGDESCATIEEIGSIEGDWQTIRISGTQLYAAGENGLTLYDVSNPVSPTFEGRYETAPISDTEVVGSLVYAVGGSEGAGLLIIDTSDPTSPTLRGAYTVTTLERVTEVDVVGDRAYLAGDTDETAESGMLVLDVSDPANPVFLGSYTRVGYPAFIEVVGDVAYYAVFKGGNESFAVLDVSDPAEIGLIRRVGTGAFDEQFVRLYAAGNRLYASNLHYSGFAIFDISIPESPSKVGDTGSAWTYAYAFADIKSRGRFLYTTRNGNKRTAGGLFLYDVLNEARPSLCTFYELPTATSLQVAGEMAYLLGAEGVEILRVRTDLTAFPLFLPVVQR
jgi:hypothetical protein